MTCFLFISNFSSNERNDIITKNSKAFELASMRLEAIITTKKVIEQLKQALKNAATLDREAESAMPTANDRPFYYDRHSYSKWGDMFRAASVAQNAYAHLAKTIETIHQSAPSMTLRIAGEKALERKQFWEKEAAAALQSEKIVAKEKARGEEERRYPRREQHIPAWAK